MEENNKNQDTITMKTSTLYMALMGMGLFGYWWGHRKGVRRMIRAYENDFKKNWGHLKVDGKSIPLFYKTTDSLVIHDFVDRVNDAMLKLNKLEELKEG